MHAMASILEPHPACVVCFHFAVFPATDRRLEVDRRGSACLIQNSTLGETRAMAEAASGSTGAPPKRGSHLAELLRPHWKALSFALLAVLGEVATDVLEPWPIKIVIDNVVQAKPLPGWLASAGSLLFAQ